MIYLPDVNVWIALAADKHVHHDVARSWFARVRDDRLAFCRITQLGFLRLLTNKHVMEEEAMSPVEAWQAYRAVRSGRRIICLAEPAGLAETWNRFTDSGLSSPSLWTDAYLCAFVNAAGLTFVTFDAKIPAIEGVKCLVLNRGTAG